MYVEHKRVAKTFTKPSMTQQNFKKECDVNQILAKYQKMQIPLPEGGSYLDLSTAPEYHDAMNIVVESQQAFDALPSSIRNRFQNDPAQLLEFVSDPANVEEMKEMGLIQERPSGQPQDAPEARPEEEPVSETPVSEVPAQAPQGAQ